MNRFWALLVLLSAASLTVACGSSSSNRQLQSITISSTVSGQQVQFTATGIAEFAPAPCENSSGPPAHDHPRLSHGVKSL
jgi:hypothetical protein